MQNIKCVKRKSAKTDAKWMLKTNAKNEDQRNASSIETSDEYTIDA